jgi:hypothetical protein
MNPLYSRNCGFHAEYRSPGPTLFVACPKAPKGTEHDGQQTIMRARRPPCSYFPPLLAKGLSAAALGWPFVYLPLLPLVPLILRQGRKVSSHPSLICLLSQSILSHNLD